MTVGRFNSRWGRHSSFYPLRLPVCLAQGVRDGAREIVGGVNPAYRSRWWHSRRGGQTGHGRNHLGRRKHVRHDRRRHHDHRQRRRLCGNGRQLRHRRAAQARAARLRTRAPAVLIRGRIDSDAPRLTATCVTEEPQNNFESTISASCRSNLEKAPRASLMRRCRA